MASIGRLVELLHDEARVAKEQSEQPAAERLRELADDIGEISAEQKAWVEKASDEELHAFVETVRLRGGA